jgi:hypothetical protein
VFADHALFHGLFQREKNKLGGEGLREYARWYWSVAMQL